LAHNAHDTAQGLLESFEDFVAVDGEGARNALGEVAAADFDFPDLASRKGGANLDLDALGGRLADEDAVVAAHVLEDGLVEAVAADPHGSRVDNAVQRQDGDLAGAAPDVENHAAAGFIDGQPGADRRGHGFLEKIDFARARPLRRVADGLALDLGGSVRNAHDHPRRETVPAVLADLADEVLEHLLGEGEVGDHPVLHRADGDDVVRGASEHALRLHPVGLDPPLPTLGVLAHGDHGRFVEHDALAPDVDQGVGGAEVDREILAEGAAQQRKHGRGSGRAWRPLL
jgi:hypothetical protein